MPSISAIAVLASSTFAFYCVSVVFTEMNKAFVGHISVLQLASLGPSSNFFDSFHFCLGFVSNATLQLLSESKSKADRNVLRSHALSLGTLAGVLESLVVFLLAIPAVEMLGASAEMLPFAVSYTRIRAYGALFENLWDILTNIFLAQQDVSSPMLSTLVACCLNAVGNHLLVPLYGISGSAMASVVALFFSFVVLALRLWCLDLWPRPFKCPSSWGDLAPFAAFAGPVFAVLMLQIVFFVMGTVAATELGEVPGAANQVLVSTFFLFGFAVGKPLGIAGQVFVSSLKGRPRECRETVTRVLLVATGAAVLAIVSAALQAEFAVGVFTEDPLVKEEVLAAVPGLLLAVVMFVFFGCLEGFARALDRLYPALWIAMAMVLASYTTLTVLQHYEKLTLPIVWAVQGSVVSAATVAMAILIACTMRGLVVAPERAEEVSQIES